MNAPKISVIIPLYNAERFIRACLISVLASKFQDYEVLVVDDCSTDNSRAEAEKLLPHFGGRLKIFSTEKNSGGAGIPRNIAIKNSSGKYITFIDNDDFLLPDALEIFFYAAEKFQADVVHTEKYFIFDDADEINFTQEALRLERQDTGDLVDAPTLETDDMRERIDRYAAGKFFWLPWGKLFLRDLILDNGIDFPQMKMGEDMVFCFKCLCCAKNYLRVPFVTNIHRVLENSAGRKILTSRDGVNIWLGVLTIALTSIDEFMSEREFFQLHPESRQEAIKFFIDKYFSFIKKLFTTVQPHEVLKIFFEELKNPALDQRGKELIAAELLTERALKK